MIDTLFLVLELIGTAAFAVSGAMTGLQKRMDLFGVCMLGVTTAVGGGVLRDILLGNVPPNMFRDPTYAAVAVAVSLILFLPGVRRCLTWDSRRFNLVLLIMDTLGLSIFTVTGMGVAYSYTARPTLFLLCFVGVITGVGGGVLRDIMAGDTPYIFRKHVYASASLAGALVCGLLHATSSVIAMFAGAVVISLIRLLSAYFRWNLPPPSEEV